MQWRYLSWLLTTAYIVTIVNCWLYFRGGQAAFHNPAQPFFPTRSRSWKGNGHIHLTGLKVCPVLPGNGIPCPARQVLEQAELLEQHYTNKTGEAYLLHIHPLLCLCRQCVRQPGIPAELDECRIHHQRAAPMSYHDGVKNCRVGWASFISTILTGGAGKLFGESSLIFHLTEASLCSSAYPILSARKRVTTVMIWRITPFWHERDQARTLEEYSAPCRKVWLLSRQTTLFNLHQLETDMP